MVVASAGVASVLDVMTLVSNVFGFFICIKKLLWKSFKQKKTKKKQKTNKQTNEQTNKRTNKQTNKQTLQPPASSGCLFRAAFDYTTEDKNEVSFEENDIIENVTTIDENWCNVSGWHYSWWSFFTTSFSADCRARSYATVNAAWFRWIIWKELGKYRFCHRKIK